MNEAPLHGLTPQELAAHFQRADISASQSRLVFQALHRHGLREPKQFAAVLPELGPKTQKYLATLPALSEGKIEEARPAADGTIKLRVALAQHEPVEAVLIPANGRLTLCVSSQAGCAAACSFCHTGTLGLRRNLQAWEIVEQHRLAKQHAPAPITNIVFMGMGEPLHNEDEVAKACAILGAGVGSGIPKRRIVVSTAGVGNRLLPFWQRDLAALALSLHATSDAVRDQLVPLNRKWNLAELKRLLLSIPWRKSETVTIAYLLLAEVNDSRADAERLAQWLDGLPAKLNVLEFNPYPGSGYRRASPEKLREFRGWLRELGVFNTLRRSRGEDVLAACGQLATNRPQKS